MGEFARILSLVQFRKTSSQIRSPSSQKTIFSHIFPERFPLSIRLFLSLLLHLMRTGPFSLRFIGLGQTGFGIFFPTLVVFQRR